MQAGNAENHDPSTRLTRRAGSPKPAKLALATASASVETSVHHTRAAGCSAATASPIAPDPHPRSAT